VFRREARLGAARPRSPLLLLAASVALAALAGGCARPPATPAGPSPGVRAAAARHSLETAREHRSQGDLARAEAVLRHGLATAPDDAALHRALAAVLMELGRSAEAEPHLRRADALDPPPAPPPDAPLARSAQGLLVVLIPPIAGDRVPQSWPDEAVAGTLQRRLARRLPDARVAHADPATVAAARGWLARFEPRAVISLRIERAYCGESRKDGRFGMAWLRVAAEVPADSSAGPAQVRTQVPEPRLAGGCLSEVSARALEEALALPLVESAWLRAEAVGARRAPWTTAALRTLFPGLGQRIEAELQSGRSALASGRLAPAAAAFERAARIDPEDLDVRAYLEETRSTLALARQIQGSSRAPTLDPSWSPSERAAADAMLADERRRRDELLALIAVLDEDLRAPPAATLATLRPAPVPPGKGFGPGLARERAGGEIEARAVYAPDGSVLSRYFFARGAPLPVLREEDTTRDGKPDRWIGYQDGTRREIWEDGRGRGRPDVHLLFAEGGEPLERIELDDDGNGQPERVFSYTRGKLTGESRDTNRDSRLDRFDRLDENGNLVLREEDVNADGAIDVRSIYSAGRLVRRQLAVPEPDPGL
jgi:Flp pilus assembly protein TadD